MSKEKHTYNKFFDAKKWEDVNDKNRKIMDKFLKSKKGLSDKTLTQYENALQIFFLWVLDEADNKFIVDLKKRDILEYQNYLIDMNLSSNGIKFKRSAVSSLCTYICNYYEDEYPTFKNIVDGVEIVKGEKVHKKEPLTKEELELLRKTLKERGLWQQLAYLEITYFTGGRRGEIRQLRKEIVDYDKNSKGFYSTHEVRCKGAGKTGKIRTLAFSEEAREAVVKWLEVRGDDDCEFIFVTGVNEGKVKQVSEGTFNNWCSDIFAKIIGRRIHPHLFRSTRATHLVTIDGKDINSAKNLLGHNSSQTTEIYVVRDEEESLGDCF